MVEPFTVVIVGIMVLGYAGIKAWHDMKVWSLFYDQKQVLTQEINE